MLNKKKLVYLVMALLLVLVSSVAAVPHAAPSAEAQQQDGQPTAPVLTDVIINDDRLDTFEALVRAGALNDNLRLDGPFTVFAPSDEAFAEFEQRAQQTGANLTEIMLYHVANGNYPAAALANQEDLTTLMGDHVQISTQNGAIVLDGTARVIEPNLEASNGVVHIIDTVLVPELEDGMMPSAATQAEAQQAAEVTEVMSEADMAQQEGPMDLQATLEADGRFDTLLSVLQLSAVMDVLQQRNDFTLFAPTDAAFNAIPEDRLSMLLAEPQGELSAILAYHAVGDSLSVNQIANDDLIPTLDGRPLFVTTDEGMQPYVNGVPINGRGIEVENGIVYPIDEVLIP